MRALIVVMALTLCASSSAEEKKKAPPPANNFDDLFGAPPPKTNLDAMKKATDGMGAKTSADGLAAKVGTIENGDAAVQLLNVFAAEHINQDKKLGCQPAGRDKKRVVEWSFDELPQKGQPFEVCLTLASKAGREMNMSIAIVDARNQRVAKAEDVIDFRGRSKVDHVLEYPAPMFKLPGQYFYVVDLDGKEAGRMPIFTVKVETESKSSGALGSGPSDAPTAPVTAKEPDEPTK